MTRIIWQWIKDKLIFPFIDIELDYYDLGMEHRDATDDHVTIEAAEAIQTARRRRESAPPSRRMRRGLKEFKPQEDVEVAQRHDPQYPGRRGLPRADHLQERTATGAGLDPAHHHRPPCLWRPVPRHRLQGSRAGYHDASPGRATTARPSSTRSSSTPTAGVAMAMYNLDDSIRDFAHASFAYALARKYPLYLSSKNTILKAYDGRFKDIFQEVYQARVYVRQVQGRGPDLRTPPDRRHGGRRDEMVGRLCLGLQEL